jgi:hypothetical protein
MNALVFLIAFLTIATPISVSGQHEHLRRNRRRSQLMGGYHAADPNDPMVTNALTFVQSAFVQNTNVKKLYSDLFLMTNSPQNLVLVIWKAQTQVRRSIEL